VAHTGSTDRERTQKRRHIKALKLTGAFQPTWVSFGLSGKGEEEKADADQKILWASEGSNESLEASSGWVTALNLIGSQ
jgi:hypothetical protein